MTTAARCCTCRKALETPHKTFTDSGRGWCGGRGWVAKTYWCRPCWEAFETFEKRSRRAADEALAAEIAEMRTTIEKEKTR